MTTYNKRIGRISLDVSREGFKMPDYVHGTDLCIHNNETVHINLSLEELRDLKYLIERALAQQDPAEIAEHLARSR